MSIDKTQLRKRTVTGWRQLERRKSEIRTHNARRGPQAGLLPRPVKP